ncbi:tetratricopeptide repeat protein [Mastigocladopsis repens]|uniref:tetratricopeptide repeat protein n=1 Tax=Mastigocladopsis repens TaxID=221287 RepID=UPI0002D6C4E2|nr:tetratricopeptide repeat protein [Mastigocladopsis repens]
MFDFQPSYIIAITAVISSITLLVYFSWKTLITSNLFQKGVNLYQQENYKDAEAAFRQVISRNSTNDGVHLLLGDSLMQQSKVEEATQQFQEVIDRAPKKVDAYLRLSNALMRQEKKGEAIATLQKARDLCLAQRQPEKAEQINSILQKISKNNS